MEQKYGKPNIKMNAELYTTNCMGQVQITQKRAGVFSTPSSSSVGNEEEDIIADIFRKPTVEVNETIEANKAKEQKMEVRIKNLRF